MENQIKAMDATAANSTQESDAQLVSTLREIDPHNYAYLFERCKSCNVKARHLRFFKKDQIHELIPKSELGILAEFEYLLNQWQISKGYTSLYTQIQLNRYDDINNDKPQAQSNLIVAKEEPHTLCNNQRVVVAEQAIDIKPLTINLQGPQNSSAAMVVDEPEELLTVLDSHENSNPSNLKRLKFYEDDEEKFKLEIIIPELLKNLKESYKSKNSLSTNERRLLSSSIVHYFESGKIKFGSYTMNDLAEQIVEHFPTEDKKSWFNGDSRDPRGSFVYRLYNLRRNMAKQTNNTPTSIVVTNSASSEDEDVEEQLTLETIIPKVLKNLKDSYESKNSLSTIECRLLCSSIVDYFERRKIKFSLDTMEELAEQIVEHFPTEDKKSWCNRDGRDTRGRLFFRRNYSRKNKQTNNTSTSKVVISSTSSEDDDEQFTLESIIPKLLKKLKDSYESKNSLSTIERRHLCSAIVDYFERRKIKFSLDTMDELAEQIVEHFPTEDKKSWYDRVGHKPRGSFYFRVSNSRKKRAKETNNTSTLKAITNATSSEDEYHEQQFTLETIIPKLLKKLKDSYESKNSLSKIECRLLCSSIVDYFERRKIKFSSYTMDDLAEQIVDHFPTEDKKSWFNRDENKPRGRFVFRLSNSRKRMGKQTNNTSTSKVVTNSTSSEDDEEQFTLETIIPELLKNLKERYESKKFLSTIERRLLCSSIVDYFQSRKIKFSLNTMKALAVQIGEHFPTEDKNSWYNDYPNTRGRLFYRRGYLLRNKRTNNTSTSKAVTNSTFSEDDEEQFTLETIIPELLKKLEESYESKNSLSTIECRLLCNSIVDYFERRKIKFSFNTMDELAEQIVDNFPTEDKKSWFNRDENKPRGRFVFRLINLRKRMGKQTNNICTSKAVTNSTSNEDDEEQFVSYTLEIIIPELLKNLKENYESQKCLSTKERRLLCDSIMDYFESRKIKFSLDTMDELAEQIVEHFPTEDKKTWYNDDAYRSGGPLFRRSYLRRNNQSNSNEEQFTLEIIIPKLLKNLKESYESKEFLSTIERRLLCSSIVDYFESRNIKFSLDTMDELSEQIVEHFPTEDKKTWFSDDPNRRGRLFFRRGYLRRMKQTSNTSTFKAVTNSTSSEEDEEQFTLETIIPELLKKLEDSYESKNSLSTIECRLLCSSIVDYFVSKNIKFSLDTMDELAEQIVDNFPTEDKKSWFDGNSHDPRGLLFYRFQYVTSSRYKKDKLSNDTSNSKTVINSTLSEPESREEVHDEDSKSIQTWLKSHKCENFSEVIDLWEDSMNYRCWQMQNLKDLKSILEFLNNWPSYKLETGHELLTMDFKYLYSQAMETFRTRWLVYKQHIEQFLKVELKDVNCLKLLEEYQLQKPTIDEDSISCILIYLVHAITKQLHYFEGVSGNVSYAVTDSQHSMMRLIRHKVEVDEYTEPYPCIFVVGDSLLEVQECYVVFKDLCYKLSYENCLAVCVQIFTVLKVEDPPASQCFWEFIRGYMFNIAMDKEKFNLATENMVNYLETAASRV